jgi:hypothetical protein
MGARVQVQSGPEWNRAGEGSSQGLREQGFPRDFLSLRKKRALEVGVEGCSVGRSGACQMGRGREAELGLGVDARCGSPGRVESGRGKKTRRAISCLNHDKLITMLGEIDCGLGFGVARARLSRVPKAWCRP